MLNLCLEKNPVLCNVWSIFQKPFLGQSITNFSSQENISLSENFSIFLENAWAQLFSCCTVIGSKERIISFERYPTLFNCSNVWWNLLTTNIFSKLRLRWNATTKGYETGYMVVPSSKLFVFFATGSFKIKTDSKRPITSKFYAVKKSLYTLILIFVHDHGHVTAAIQIPFWGFSFYKKFVTGVTLIGHWGCISSLFWFTTQ